MKCTVDGNVIHMDVSNNSEQWHHFMEELSITTLAKHRQRGKTIGPFHPVMLHVFICVWSWYSLYVMMTT